MNTKIKIFIGFIVLVGLGLAGPALAHNPRIVSGTETVIVQNPEISQAFYGELQGGPQWFEINSDKNFVLYVNILVPKLPGISTGIAAEIYRSEDGGQQLITSIDGENFGWSEFFEPFGGDTYLKGPEFKADVQAGKYLIKVTHCHADEPGAENEAECSFLRYSLAIGEQEKFTPKEIINAIYLLPVLKKDFFNESPFTAYFNYSGLFMLGTLIILFVVIYLAIRLVKKFRKKDAPVTI